MKSNRRDFLRDSALLSASLAAVPGILVHGRFDCIAPMDNSHMLRRVWTNAQLFIVREAGHTATEPAMIDALIRATRDMALRFEADFDV